MKKALCRVIFALAALASTYAQALGYPSKPVRFSMYAPAKTPEDIILKLNAEMRKYLASKVAKEAFISIGMDSAPSTPEELRARIIAGQKVLGKAVKDAKLKVE